MTLHPGASGIVVLVAAALIAVAVLGIHLGLLSPYTGFRLAMPAWLGGGLVALVLALLSLRSERPAWLGLVLAVVMLLPALLLVRNLLRAPVIHDVSTDVTDPPAFVAAAAADPARDLSYPHGNPRSAAMQLEAYPDLRPLDLGAPPAQALSWVDDAVAQLGWTVTRRDTAGGLLEATATSTVFRFVDDIVIRARPIEGGTRIDVRSLSRVGRSDLGANAARIRAFLTLLQALAAEPR